MNLKQTFAAGFAHARLNQPASEHGDASGSSSGAENSSSTDGKNKSSEANGDEGGGGKGDDKGDSKKEEKPGMSEAEAKLLKEVMQKKERIQEQESKLESQGQEIAELQSQLKKFDGLDLDRVNALLSEADKAEEKRLEAQGEWNRLKERMAEQHQQEVEKVTSEFTTQVEELRAQLEASQGSIVELTVGNAFSGSMFINEELVLTPAKARTVYGEHFEVQDGKVVAYDAPKSNKERTMIVDANGSPLAFDDAMRKIVDLDADRDALIRSKMKQGANSNSDNSTSPDAKAAPKSGTDKIFAGLQSMKK